MKTRVLIVDDSAVVRRLLTDLLSADPDIEVVGSAANAALALAKIKQAPPDVVTLDVEMPDVSGLELLVEIRKIAPRLPVIMFSALTQRAAETTLDALARGATDYVTKPLGAASREEAAEHVRAQLIPKIKALGPRAPAGAMALMAQRSAAIDVRRTYGPIEVLAIGTSTGGPNALAALFREIPADLQVPVVIVQHMPPLFTQLLGERLSNDCPLTFSEAKHGELLRPGHAYIAPGDHHMRVVRSGGSVSVAIDQAAHENSCRPAVDVLFRSVATVYEGRSLAVILTGMGQDGLKGCELIHAQGGQIIVQDEATSVVWGMPGFVARAGLAHKVLPLPEIAPEIVRRIMSAPTKLTGSSKSGERHHVR